MEFLSKRAGLIVRILISVAILVFIIYRVDVERTAAIMGAMSVPYLVAAFAAFGGMILLTTLRWEYLLHVQGIAVGFGRVLRLTLIGQFFNSFLLGATGGDVVKIFYVARENKKQRAGAALSVVVDRMIGLLVLIAYAVLACVVAYGPLTSAQLAASSGQGYFNGWVETAGQLAVWIVFAVGAAALALIFTTLLFPVVRGVAERMGIWERLPFREMIEKLHTAWQRYHQASLSLLLAVVFSFANHAVSFLMGLLIVLSMGFEVKVGLFLAIVPVVFLLMSLPISVAGLGVRELLAGLFFPLVGGTTEHGVAFGLTYYVLTLIWSFIGGIVFVQYRSPSDEALGEEDIDPFEDVEREIQAAEAEVEAGKGTTEIS